MCRKKKKPTASEVEIKFSVKATLINIFLSLVGGFILSSTSDFEIVETIYNQQTASASAAYNQDQQPISKIAIQIWLSFLIALVWVPGVILTILSILATKCFTPSLGVYKPSIPNMAFVFDKNTREAKQREDHKAIEEEENLRKEKEGKVWTKEEMEEFSRKSEASRHGHRMGQGIIHSQGLSGQGQSFIVLNEQGQSFSQCLIGQGHHSLMTTGVNVPIFHNSPATVVYNASAPAFYAPVHNYHAQTHVYQAPAPVSYAREVNDIHPSKGNSNNLYSSSKY